jgi:hypothetical protein
MANWETLQGRKDYARSSESQASTGPSSQRFAFTERRTGSEKPQRRRGNSCMLICISLPQCFFSSCGWCVDTEDDKEETSGHRSSPIKVWCIVLANVPLWDHFDNSWSMKSLNQLVQFRVLLHGSLYYVHQYCSEYLELGMSIMQLWMAHLLVVSDFWYLQNSASGFESTVILRSKSMFLHHRLPSFDDMEHWRPPKDALCKAS